MDRLTKQMEFIMEIDKLKRIDRQTYLSGEGKRRENDAEHSWHLAMMALLLSEYASEKVDVLRVIGMVLIHDLVEIDAGDTYAYDSAGNTTKRDREVKAAERIFNILPKEQAAYIRGLWDEFEEGVTPEARFAGSLDKVQPILLNDSKGGVSWREHEVKYSQILKRNEKTPLGAEKLWEFAHDKIKDNVEKGNIIDE